jgi:hypothetical protein
MSNTPSISIITNKNNKNNKIYKDNIIDMSLNYCLALNDTIHDFGGTSGRGDNIQSILKGILTEAEYSPFTFYGNNKIINKSPFERNIEAYILDNYDLIGIPGDTLDGEPFFIWKVTGDDGNLYEINVYRYENKNSFVNYALKMNISTIIELTEDDKNKIYNNPSEIHPSIDTLSTILITDKEENITKSVSQLPKKNRLGQFIMKFYFFGENNNNFIVHNADAGSGNLKCAFAKGFQDNVLGVVKNTTNYGDSAYTSSGTKKVSKCKDTADNNPNPFLLDVGATIQTKTDNDGNLVFEKKDKQRENIYKLPSIFPKTRLDSKYEIWIFNNNIFTYDKFIIGFKSRPNNQWIPHQAPYNFSLVVYKRTGTDRNEQITDILNTNPDPIGEAPFFADNKNMNTKYSMNGPSVIYLKQLIGSIMEQKFDFSEKGFHIRPESNCIYLGSLLYNVYSKYIKENANTPVIQKNILIKLLLDLKRCGDYEQVDAVKEIQIQNEGVKNIFGLQDILFTSIDRLCTLYSRHKQNNCMWVKPGERIYTMYRQPYIYPSPEEMKEFHDRKAYIQFKRKVEYINNFLTEINIYNNNDNTTPPDVNSLYSLVNNDFKDVSGNDDSSNIKRIFFEIYTYQQNRLTNPNGPYIGNENLSELIETFGNIASKMDGDFSKTSTVIQLNGNDIYINLGTSGTVNVNDQTQNKTKTINELFDMLNQEIYHDFNIITIPDLVYDPVGMKNKRISYDIVTMKNTKTIDMLTQLNKYNNNTQINNEPNYYKSYYNDLSNIMKNFDSIGDPVERRSGSTVSMTVFTKKLTDWLYLKGLMAMVKNIFNIKINETDATNVEKVVSYLTNKIIFMSLSDVLDDPQDTEYKEIMSQNKPYQTIITNLINVINENKVNININENIKNEISKTTELYSKIKKNKLDAKIARQDKLEAKKNKKMSKNKEKYEKLLDIDQSKRKTRSSSIKEIQQKKMKLRSSYKQKGGETAVITNQTGGGETGSGEPLLGGMFYDMIYDNTGDIMNQIYSDHFPNELLQTLLLNFDINYSGFQKRNTYIPVDNNTNVVVNSTNDDDDDNDAINFSNVDDAIKDKEPLVLDRSEYMTQYFTELYNYLSMNNYSIRDEISRYIRTDPSLNEILTEANKNTYIEKLNVLANKPGDISGIDISNIDTILFEDTWFTGETGEVGLYEIILNYNETKVDDNKNVNKFINKIICNEEIKKTISDEFDTMTNTIFDILNQSSSTYYREKNILIKFLNNGSDYYNSNELTSPNKAFIDGFCNILKLVLDFTITGDVIKYNSDAKTYKIYLDMSNATIDTNADTNADTNTNIPVNVIDNVVDVSLNKVIDFINTSVTTSANNTRLDTIKFKDGSNITKLDISEIRVLIYYYFSLLVNIYGDKDSDYFPMEPTINTAIKKSVYTTNMDDVGKFFDTKDSIYNGLMALCRLLSIAECPELSSESGTFGGGKIKRRTNRNKKKRRNKKTQKKTKKKTRNKSKIVKKQKKTKRTVKRTVKKTAKRIAKKM